MSKKLTLKQEKFINNYIKSGNGTQSVIGAGYNCKDETVAKSIACENLTKPYIMKRKQEILAKTERETVLSLIERKEKLSNIVRHSIEMPVSAGHIIAAADQLNKLDGSYPPEKHAVIGDILIEVIHRDVKETDANKTSQDRLSEGVYEKEKV